MIMSNPPNFCEFSVNADCGGGTGTLIEGLQFGPLSCVVCSFVPLHAESLEVEAQRMCQPVAVSAHGFSLL